MVFPTREPERQDLGEPNVEPEARLARALTLAIKSSATKMSSSWRRATSSTREYSPAFLPAKRMCAPDCVTTLPEGSVSTGSCPSGTAGEAPVGPRASFSSENVIVLLINGRPAAPKHTRAANARAGALKYVRVYDLAKGEATSSCARGRRYRNANAHSHLVGAHLCAV